MRKAWSLAELGLCRRDHVPSWGPSSSVAQLRQVGGSAEQRSKEMPVL